MKKTVVLGATPNPARYAYLATKRLKQAGHEVIPIGIKKGEIESKIAEYNLNTKLFYCNWCLNNFLALPYFK